MEELTDAERDTVALSLHAAMTRHPKATGLINGIVDKLKLRKEFNRIDGGWLIHQAMNPFPGRKKSD